MRIVNKGITAVLPFEIYDATGILANATTPPIIRRIMVNGTITTIAGTSVEQQQDATPANITGRYQAKIPTATLAANDQVQVQIEATVNGMTVPGDLNFSVTDVAAGRPRIETY